MAVHDDAWSYLSKTSSQVLICDLQTQIVARSKTITPQNLAKSAHVLAQAAQLLKLPLTLSVVPENQEAPQLIPELRPFATGENQFPRANASPRPVILLAGFATEVVVLHGALQAMQAGHRVIVALDACGGMSPATEAAAQQQLRDSGAIISSVVSIATALSPDFTSQEGQKLFGIVQALRLA